LLHCSAFDRLQVVLGVILYWAGVAGASVSMTWAEAMAYASALSATDPVATLSIFSSLRVHPTLNALVFGEAVANDGAGSVLYKTFLRFTVEPLSATSVGNAIGEFIMLMVASAGLGCVVAAAGIVLLRHSNVKSRIVETGAGPVVITSPVSSAAAPQSPSSMHGERLQWADSPPSRIRFFPPSPQPVKTVGSGLRLGIDEEAEVSGPSLRPSMIDSASVAAAASPRCSFREERQDLRAPSCAPVTLGSVDTAIPAAATSARMSIAKPADSVSSLPPPSGAIFRSQSAAVTVDSLMHVSALYVQVPQLLALAYASFAFAQVRSMRLLSVSVFYLQGRFRYCCSQSLYLAYWRHGAPES
jgi:hypothetical protein